PLLLFFIAKKSNQKRLVQLIASGYLIASALLGNRSNQALVKPPVKIEFSLASAFWVNLRCSYVFPIC
ncbi:MAG: hypothetical protein J5I52_04250, partial [Saprospiraceae bacterium]|nr:hypothetical protein [Saprospiraceae bacterium]